MFDDYSAHSEHSTLPEEETVRARCLVDDTSRPAAQTVAHRKRVKALLENDALPLLAESQMRR